MRKTIAAAFLLILITAMTAAENGDDKMSDMEARLAKYTKVEVSSDIPGLNAGERALLRKLIGAAKLMDIAFWMQASEEGLGMKAVLEASKEPGHKDLLHFLNINKCGYDRMANFEPFIGGEPRPAGATFWPEDLTREELESYVAKHPEEKEALYNLYTVVRRDGERLVAIPYHVVYEGLMRAAAATLLESTLVCEHEGLKRFLELRARALLTDDYFESDMAWLDLQGNKFDIVIGAIEPYEDGLMSLKAGYEAFVLVKDEAASRELQAYIDSMDEMQQALPVAKKFKQREVQLGSSVGVFTLVFAAGDGDAGIKTIAISLPNDERVRAAKGTRKIMLRNAIDAKFNKILLPIAERILAPDQFELVDGALFFSDILLHEVAHSLGNDFVLDADGNETGAKVDIALKQHSAALEECKADIAGLYSAELMMRKGVIPPEKRSAMFATFLAGIFRSVRFGAASAHGVANAIEVNWLISREGIRIDESGRWHVNEEKFAEAVADLCAELLSIQHRGDYERAGKLVSRFGTLPEQLARQLAGMDDIPVDIEFVWK